MHAVDILARERSAAYGYGLTEPRRSRVMHLNSAEDRRFGAGLGFGLLLSVLFWVGLAAMLLR